MSEDQKPFAIHELQIENPEQKASKCELCGSEVRVVGNTTLHYEPMQEPRVAREHIIARDPVLGRLYVFPKDYHFGDDEPPAEKWNVREVLPGFIEYSGEPPKVYIPTEVRQAYEAMQEISEGVASVLDDMQHYFGNKCVPTFEEVHKCADIERESRRLLAALEARWPELKGAKE